MNEKLGRRTFLRWLPWVIGGGTFFLARCGSETSGTDKTFSNTDGSSHSHTVTLDCSTVDTPPSGGVTLTTSSTNSHSHTLTLSESQLNSIQGGSTLTLTTDTDGTGHAHSFAVSDC